MATSMTIKIICGLLALLIVVRLLGKKELSQITPFDFVYILVLGGLLEESVYDDKVTIWQVLFAIALWAILIFTIEKIVQKFDKIRPAVKGEPTVIVHNGELDLNALKKNKLESEQLRTMLRQQGIFSINEVKYAVLEPSGQLSVLKHELTAPVTAEMLSVHPKETALSYLVIDEGKMEKKALKKIGKDATWLQTELAKSGYTDISKIYYAEWSSTDGFTVRGTIDDTENKE
ncbi:DUF421 domain-containing protein [Oceanobacillus alkalisoli]|uniref:DUF421 domain-containing protein n=1 Tax=Oceanobacillus alkalisoli TaxID=2925113 RepID=UPI001EF12522|nr:DUF421 domain-containing protein [Oceanobacillus alkalisoli]MCF3943234.1 DUF421 domain-containing protein [Oceanobacillus alkalisoli]MCG5103888.1 DUF421 domain-containing protein [Oceanobacillus alkalisoli]